MEPWELWFRAESRALPHPCARIKRQLISGILLMSTEMHCTKGTERCPSISPTMGDSHAYLWVQSRAYWRKVLAFREEKKTNFLSGEHSSSWRGKAGLIKSPFLDCQSGAHMWNMQTQLNTERGVVRSCHQLPPATQTPDRQRLPSTPSEPYLES